MNGTDALISRLIAIDHMVSTGLAKFDEFTSRLGVQPAEGARDTLARDFWMKGADLFLAPGLPPGVLHDLFIASSAIRAGLSGIDEIISGQLAQLRALRVEHAALSALAAGFETGRGDDTACNDAVQAADAEVAAFRQDLDPKHADAHRRCWVVALEQIMPPDVSSPAVGGGD